MRMDNPNSGPAKMPSNIRAIFLRAVFDRHAKVAKSALQ